MMRMEIALILVLVFVAFVYFSAGRRNTPLHKTFSTLLVVTPLHLALDTITVYTVNHMETVPPFLNEVLHRLFIGTMVVVVYLFYRYISILVEEETKKTCTLSLCGKNIFGNSGIFYNDFAYEVYNYGKWKLFVWHLRFCMLHKRCILFTCMPVAATQKSQTN